MKIAFYTVSDRLFLKGALPLMRSVEHYFPECSRHIISLKDDISRKDVPHGIEVHEFDKKPHLPPFLESKRHFITKYFCNPVDADYLIYVDADTILSGHIPHLLDVPRGKVGFVREDYLGYTVRNQFNKDFSDNDLKALVGDFINKPSFNSGVFCGYKENLLALRASLDSCFQEDTWIRHSLTDQGLLAVALSRLGHFVDLSNPCNMIDEKWDGVTPSVLHFAGWPRPWVWNRARPDNSFPAFRHWRTFSNLADFVDKQEALKEFFWRCLDDLRPYIRQKRKG